MRKIVTLPIAVGLLGGLCSAFGGFQYYQSYRGEVAAISLDLHASLPDAPLARARFVATRQQLAQPRDARLWELEAERLLRLGGPQALENAADALTLAAKKSPVRSSIRMRQAYVASQLKSAGADMSTRIEQWYEIAPHDLSMQSYRVALASRAWQDLRPQARLLIMQDAEDLCIRYGKQQVIDMFGEGGAEPRTAAALRLSRVGSKCVGYEPA
jgi:hypothetical protein